MQSYAINLAAGAAQTYTSAARRFVYESGATVPQGGDSRIIVKPANGNEIMLRPGQGFGLDEGQLAATWYVRGVDPTVPIVGTIIIGSGDFADNSLKIDATSGAVSVIPAVPFQIGNTAANRVPVALDPATEKAIQEYPLMSYTHSRTFNLGPNLNAPLVTAAENINGVIIESGMSLTTVVEKAVRLLVNPTSPVSEIDGDIIVPFITSQMTVNPSVRRVKVAAGKAVWARNVTGQTFNSTFLLTIL